MIVKDILPGISLVTSANFPPKGILKNNPEKASHLLKEGKAFLVATLLELIPSFFKDGDDSEYTALFQKIHDMRGLGAGVGQAVVLYPIDSRKIMADTALEIGVLRAVPVPIVTSVDDALVELEFYLREYAPLPVSDWYNKES